MTLDTVKLLERLEQTYDTAFEEVYCQKFSGALSVELIRHHLLKHGIPVSQRDVFIKNIPIEIDLVIPRRGASAKHRLLYEPDDVVAALEIKYRGAVGAKTLQTTRQNFKRITQDYKHIQCIYIAVNETATYKYAVRSASLGFPAYTLVWYRGQKQTASTDWNRLIKRLSKALHGSTSNAQSNG
jgi:hypothetical protein